MVCALLSSDNLSHKCFSGVFWADLPSQTGFTDESPVWNTSAESQYQAIEDSWTADFVDPSPLKGLREHIVEQLTKPSQPPVYGCYFSILQSSGMGKLRLLDKFSKSYFLIPLNLHALTDRGYPPADAQYFLLTLFIKTKEILRDMGRTKSDLDTKTPGLYVEGPINALYWEEQDCFLR
ncbi:hypothetical protein BJY52DRAFT_1192720 [Lactarius psammicola]|nr:hypothetical protein BJY52DRAFT_1192720 [Lactarius psammicola]